LFVFSKTFGDKINDFGYLIEQFGDGKIKYILVILYDIKVKIPLNLVIGSIQWLVIFKLNLVIFK